jgi:hypothetical protein
MSSEQESYIQHARATIDRLIDEKNSLLAEITRLREQRHWKRSTGEEIETEKMSPWEPIATAPTDDAPILVYADVDGFDFFQVVTFDAQSGDDHVWSRLDGTAYHREAFTHWQPLSRPGKIEE